jgi:diguanylate cyclase (GGDEF)-like protein/PAS domain S-box-containing protein
MAARPRRCEVARQRKDAFAVVLECDDAITAALGWSPADMIGKRSLDFVHPADSDRVVANWMEMIGTPGAVSACTVRYLHKDGSYVPVEIVNHNRLASDGFVLGEMRLVAGENATADGAVREVSGESREGLAGDVLARVFRDQQRLVRRLTEGLPNGVVQLDADGGVLHANTLAGKLLGATDARDVGELFAGVARNHRRRVEAAVAAALRGNDRDLEVMLDAPHGGLRLLLNLRALFGEFGEPAGAIVCVTDVTGAHRLRAELERRATVDSLTGCRNRGSIIEELSQALEAGGAVAVVYVDLDDFKSVNDRLGHAAGDELLAVVAARLRAAARAGDVVGRLGGDEFLVVCRGVPTSDVALAVAARVVHAAREPVALRAGTVAVNLSVGVAQAPGHGGTADDLIHAADVAMYRAKRGLATSPNLASAVSTR